MRHTATPDSTTRTLELPALAAGYVSLDAQERLRLYAATLGRWTRAINLVSHRDQDLVASHHIPASVRLAALLPPGLDRAIDLGSGGGLPALPLSIVSNLTYELIEADRRKATFLQEAARITEAPVRVHCCRIEQSGVAPADLVTARALAPLRQLLGYAKPHLTAGGVCIFPKGANAAAELEDARTQWRFSCRQYAAGSNEASVVLLIGDLQHA